MKPELGTTFDDVRHNVTASTEPVTDTNEAVSPGLSEQSDVIRSPARHHKRITKLMQLPV
jgi:hypothetical protein